MLIELKFHNARAVADTMGGELISYMDGSKTEYLWSGDEAFWAGRSPHLFPVIGTLKGGRVRIKGDYYSLSKHGFARNSDFEVYEIKENSVTFVLHDCTASRKVYPCRFSLYITHTLEEKGFTTGYKIINEDDTNLYFNIGGHVGVKCPIMDDENFSEYEIIFDRPLTTGAYFPPNDAPIVTEWFSGLLDGEDTLSLSYSLFEKGPLVIDKIDSHSLKLRNKQNGGGIHFQYEGFPVLALWTFGMKKAPYLCLEPWHGLPAMEQDGIDFAEKPYVISLQPDGIKCLHYSVRIL